jgi:hypothetical protein
MRHLLWWVQIFWSVVQFSQGMFADLNKKITE